MTEKHLFKVLSYENIDLIKSSKVYNYTPMNKITKSVGKKMIANQS